MPNPEDRQAIKDKHAEIKAAASAKYDSPDARKKALQKLQEEKRALVGKYRGQKPETLNSKPDVTKKVLNYLRQAGPPPAPGQGIAYEE